jgi:hypothetical protein
LTTFFPAHIPFLSFSCLITLAKNSSNLWNNCWHAEDPHLVPDVRKNGFWFYPFGTLLAIGLSNRVLTVLGYVLSSPSFIEAFVMKGYWILLVAFSTCDFCPWFNLCSVIH